MPLKAEFNIKLLKQSGQSAVEFVLIAPILFILFFGIIQLFYCVYVSFAVQKATNSIAQQAASSMAFQTFEPHFQIITALFPLEKLNSTTLLCALSSKCDIQEQNKRIIATVSYPMPIWVPLMGPLFGQPLGTSSSPLLSASNNILGFLDSIGLQLPTLNIPVSSTSVMWFTFQADCLDETTVGTHS